MKFKLIALISLTVIIAALWSCERDDICSAGTSTTPRLYIQFYNIASQANLKNVTDFYVQGVGNDTPLLEVSTVNEIYLPLKTTVDNIEAGTTTTEFIMIKNYEIDDNGTPDDPSDDMQTGNQDILKITYQPEQIYVSRACGYKTVFKNISVVVEDDNDNWMTLIQPTNTINLPIDNELNAHYFIYH